MITNEKILIVGLGMIGGSYARGLSKKGIIPYAIDIDLKSLEYVSSEGFIRMITKDEYNMIDLIILCLYPKKNVEWLKENQNLLKQGCIITDVSGIKREIVKEINEFLRDDIEFLPSHPMAGKESSGFFGSDEKVFINANFLITPTEKNSLKTIMKVKELAYLLEFGNIEIINIDEHDKMVSYLSQLTHVIAICLMNSHETNELIRYTGDSFRDLTRIAKINENLWYELFVLNKDFLINDIDAFISQLTIFKEELLTNSEELIKDKMIKSTEKRRLFDKKKD